MKSRFSLRLRITLLILSLSLLTIAKTVMAQSACVGDCLSQLSYCQSQTGGSPECEDQYDACVESCLSEDYPISGSSH